MRLGERAGNDLHEVRAVAVPHSTEDPVAVDQVNAAYLNMFVNQVRPKAVAFETWAGRLNQVAQSDPDMDEGLKVATQALYANAKAALDECNAIAKDLGWKF
jgi:hypothetical protein